MEGKLNIKKVVIAISILVLLIVSITVFVISRITKKEVDDNTTNKSKEVSTTAIFTDVENTISVEIPKKYNLEQLYNSEYLIKLSSTENLNIYISKMEKIEGRDLAVIARADKLAYLESYNSYSNVSDLKELEVNGNRAFAYSFHYLDENLKKAFYIQVILLEIGEEIYIFDVDFPLDDLVLYTNVATETLATFTKL